MKFNKIKNELRKKVAEIKDLKDNLKNLILLVILKGQLMQSMKKLPDYIKSYCSIIKIF